MSFLQKKMEKFRQIWPQQPLKHFTAAYRGSPPCTQSQHPINRETGYSNVLATEYQYTEFCISLTETDCFAQNGGKYNISGGKRLF